MHANVFLNVSKWEDEMKEHKIEKEKIKRDVSPKHFQQSTLNSTLWSSRTCYVHCILDTKFLDVRTFIRNWIRSLLSLSCKDIIPLQSANMISLCQVELLGTEMLVKEGSNIFLPRGTAHFLTRINHRRHSSTIAVLRLKSSYAAATIGENLLMKLWLSGISI